MMFQKKVEMHLLMSVTTFEREYFQDKYRHVKSCNCVQLKKILKRIIAYVCLTCTSSFQLNIANKKQKRYITTVATVR